jgi:hypothetical protein
MSLTDALHVPQDFDKSRSDPGLPLLDEISWHLDKAAQLTRAFVGREEDMARLEETLSGDYNQRLGLTNQPTIVIGEPGVGKSALLAMAGIQSKIKRPGSVLAMRFAGTSDQSSNARKCVQSIITQLRRVYGAHEDALPADHASLRIELEKCMRFGAPKEPVNVIIDALEDLGTTQGYEPNFDWMPRMLSENCALVMSIKTTSAPHLAVLNTIFTGEVYFRVYALKAHKGNAALDKWLHVTNRTGTALAHFEMIRNCSANSAGLEGTPLNCSPLFIEYAIDLSNSWLSFEPPPQLPSTITGLVEQLMSELEKAHGSITTQRALSFMIMSRDGLTFPELLDLLACDDDVIDEVYGIHAPTCRRLPDMRARRLAHDLERLTGKRRTMGAHIRYIRHSLIADVATKKYALEDKGNRTKYHYYLAHYWTSQWVDGKGIWRDLQPIDGFESHAGRANQADNLRANRSASPQLFWRGIHEQPVFFKGSHPLLLHKRDIIPNTRKLREMPYHIVWSSGRTTSVDPITRTVLKRPPTSHANRSIQDRTSQTWFETYVCNLDFVRAACQAGLGHELYEDLLLASKIFIYSEKVIQFQKWMRGVVDALAKNSALTLQVCDRVLRGCVHVECRYCSRVTSALAPCVYSTNLGATNIAFTTACFPVKSKRDPCRANPSL